ncbi:GPI-anchored protein LLG1-like isoform X1 [Camellia sinensis]|uniref:GPI-anchored protein LLG1-like isoform X1 n=1 Tax=Camellia sinensis TaxID=4442 RepID=UPI001035E1B0|nr:GPI-anchored protein LLG1-like isoform X1 [Camellia sinensis]
MEQKNQCSLPSSSTLFLLAFFFLVTSLSVSASAYSFISDDIFGGKSLMGRNLLQAKTACPVNFEFLNYTIITSQCKGPQYVPNSCCPAFKELACPYVDSLNDLSNNCVETMFSYINLYGNYPAGLFATLCQDDKQGLACLATVPTQSAYSISGSQIVRNPSLLSIRAASAHNGPPSGGVIIVLMAYTLFS